MATKLHPFRQYNENDVINLFTFDGTSCDSGRLVSLDTAKAWTGLGSDDYVDLGSDTGAAYDNVVSTQFALKGKVDLCALATAPLGLPLLAMAETDENGEKLLYNPRKAAEMGVVIPGQAIPIASRGVFLYRSSDSDWTGSTIAPNTPLYGAANGVIHDASGSSAVRVGTALGLEGAVDSGGYVAALIKIELG